MPRRAQIPPIERARIRVESGCDDATIRHYPAVSEASRRRIERAADELAIALPGRPQPLTTEPPSAA